jgi:hypothetical protein
MDGPPHSVTKQRWNETNAHEIRLWVPVTIIKDNNIGGSKIYAQTAGTGGQHKNELLAFVLIVLVDGVDTILVRGATINTAVL